MRIIETVFKQILEKMQVAYDEHGDTSEHYKEYVEKIVNEAAEEYNEGHIPEFICNLSDTKSKWRCSCGHVFLTEHNEGILKGTDVSYCCNCGVKFNWSD